MRKRTVILCAQMLLLILIVSVQSFAVQSRLIKNQPQQQLYAIRPWAVLGRKGQTEPKVPETETQIKNITTASNKTTEPIISSTTSTETKPLKLATKQQSRNPQGALFDSWDAYNENDRTITKQLPKNILPSIKKSLNETITWADLEIVLKEYVKESDLGRTIPKKQASTSATTTGGVAFPQQSILSYKSVKIGSTISGSIAMALLLTLTVSSNLWLLGTILGAVAGYDVSKHIDTTPPNNTLATLNIAMGRRLAKAYLTVYDAMNGIWFMYKTGQLSYEYYKTYSKLDQRFDITNKMDAWNARFQEGKRQFDKWERENEVGRKLLAGMRTAWLVEEQSLKKGRTKYSKYRIIQWYYNISEWFRRLFSSVWNAATGGGSTDLKDVLKGIRINISTSKLDDVGTKVGSALAALLTVYLVGSLFAIAPVLLGSLAIVSGLVWPTWVPEFMNRGRDLIDDLRAHGQGIAREPKRVPPKRKVNKKAGRFSWFRRGPRTRPPLQEQWGLLGELARNRNSSKPKDKRK